MDDTEEKMGAGEHAHEDLPQAPRSPIVEPRGDHHHTSSGEISSEEEGTDSATLAALPTDSVLADGREKLHQDLWRTPLAPVLEPRGERCNSGEIVAEEEQVLRRAPVVLPASVLVDGREQHAHGHLDVESGHVSTNNRRTLLCGWATHPQCAKWAYAGLFLGGMVLAWSSRSVEVSAFSRAERDNGYCDKDRYCLGAESALRISFALFAFFVVMFVTTIRTKKVQECGNFWNSNLGVPLIIKIALVVACLYLVPFIPSSFIQFYGSAARVGAWLFLAIQLISVTRFIMWLNKWHQSNPQRRSACRRWLLKATSSILNFGSFGSTFWLLHEHRSNMVDLTIVSATLLLIVLMILIYLKSQVTAGWLAHGLMIAYVVFTCWTVLKSEPHSNYTKEKHPKGADWLTITSFVFVVIVTAYSTLTTGEDHEWLQFNEEVPSEDDIPYGYGYFHLVFALGSMYFGMLLVGWNAHQTMHRWAIDIGWWSAVVRAVNGFLAAMLYIWMLRTAFIWNKRKMVLSWPEASFVPHVRFL